MHGAVGREQARIERLAGSLAACRRCWRARSAGSRGRPPPSTSTTRMCDTSNMPASRAHRAVLVDLRAVVDRHVPAAEIHHARAGGTVQGVEGCLLRHAGFGRNEARGRRGCRALPCRGDAYFLRVRM